MANEVTEAWKGGVPLWFMVSAPKSVSSDEFRDLRSPIEMFEAGVDRLGEVASALSALVDENAAALGAIEAEGDRIDRSIGDNSSLLQSIEGFGQ